MHRLALAACLLVPSVATADTLDLGYDAAVEARGETAGEPLLVGTLSGSAAYLRSLGRDLQLDLEANAAVARMQGAVDATGATTHAALALGPSPFPPGNGDAVRAAVFPLSFELAHDGDLRALPRLSDAPDLRRAPYAWERVTVATRFLRAEGADDGVDEETGTIEDRSTFALDAAPVRASLGVTDQDGARRVDAAYSIALLAVEQRWPLEGRAEILAVEERVSQLSDGRTVTTDVAYFLRFLFPLSTGTTYEIAWGTMFGTDDSAREPVRDHRAGAGQFASFGIGAEDERRGGGVQLYRRTPYVSLDGRAMIDERGWIEGWFTARDIRWRGRAFLAHARRATPGAGPGTWTGGVEVSADRQVGPFDVGVRAEAGRSFYAALDGADPSAAFTARGGVTVRRAASRRWFY